MSLSCIKPMQPLHQAVVSLSLLCTPPSFPLLLHIQCSLLCARWAAAAAATASALLWRTIGDEHPSPTGCQGTLSTSPPWTSAVKLSTPLLFCFSLFSVLLFRNLSHSALRLAEMPTVATSCLGIYFGGDFCIRNNWQGKWFISVYTYGASFGTFLCV